MTAGGWWQAHSGQSPIFGRREVGASVPTTSLIHRHPSASLPLAPTRGGQQEQVVPTAEQSALLAFPPGLPLYLLQLKRTVSSWARNHYYMRDGHYPFRMRKLGQGSGTVRTAATFSLAHSWRSLPLRTAVWAPFNVLRVLTD